MRHCARHAHPTLPLPRDRTAWYGWQASIGIWSRRKLSPVRNCARSCCGFTPHGARGILSLLAIGSDPNEWWNESKVLEVWIQQTREAGGFHFELGRLTAYGTG